MLTIVIPAFNEEARLPATLEAIAEFLPNAFPNSEVIVVDDGSVDQSVATFQKLVAAYPIPLRIVELPVNLGKGAAVRDGVLASKGEWVLIMDADSSTPITELPRLWGLRNQAPIILGSRYLPGSNTRRAQPLVRRIISRGGNLLIRLLVGLHLSDTQNGFKLLCGDEARAIFEQTTIDRWGFDIEVLALAEMRGLGILEVPVAWTDAAGSKLRAGRDAWRTLQELLKIRQNLHRRL